MIGRLIRLSGGESDNSLSQGEATVVVVRVSAAPPGGSRIRLASPDGASRSAVWPGRSRAGHSARSLQDPHLRVMGPDPRNSAASKEMLSSSGPASPWSRRSATTRNASAWTFALAHPGSVLMPSPPAVDDLGDPAAVLFLLYVDVERHAHLNRSSYTVPDIPADVRRGTDASNGINNVVDPDARNSNRCPGPIRGGYPRNLTAASIPAYCSKGSPPPTPRPDRRGDRAAPGRDRQDLS